MTNKPMLSVERELLELVIDNKHIDKESITIRRWEALCKLRAILSKPAAQRQGEPAAFEVDVSGYTIMLAKTADKAEKTAQHYRSMSHTVDISPLFRHQAEQPAPVAVVMPELSDEELEFLKAVHAHCGSKLHSCFSEDGSDLWKRLEEIGLIKCIGSYKWELTFDAVAMGIKARLSGVKP